MMGSPRSHSIWKMLHREDGKGGRQTTGEAERGVEQMKQCGLRMGSQRAPTALAGDAGRQGVGTTGGACVQELLPEASHVTSKAGVHPRRGLAASKRVCAHRIVRSKCGWSGANWSAWGVQTKSCMNSGGHMRVTMLGEHC